MKKIRGSEKYLKHFEDDKREKMVDKLSEEEEEINEDVDEGLKHLYRYFYVFIVGSVIAPMIVAWIFVDSKVIKYNLDLNSIEFMKMFFYATYQLMAINIVVYVTNFAVQLSLQLGLPVNSKVRKDFLNKKFQSVYCAVYFIASMGVAVWLFPEKLEYTSANENKNILEENREVLKEIKDILDQIELQKKETVYPKQEG